jgi:hypothetical protein
MPLGNVLAVALRGVPSGQAQGGLHGTPACRGTFFSTASPACGPR